VSQEMRREKKTFGMDVSSNLHHRKLIKPNTDKSKHHHMNMLFRNLVVNTRETTEREGGFLDTWQ